MSGISFCTCEMISAKPVHGVILGTSEVNFSGLDLSAHILDSYSLLICFPIVAFNCCI